MECVVLGDVVLDSSTEGVQDSFEAIDFVLEVMNIGDPKPWFSSFLVHAYPIITGTPSARWLSSVAFDLQRRLNKVTD